MGVGNGKKEESNNVKQIDINDKSGKQEMDIDDDSNDNNQIETHDNKNDKKKESLGANSDNNSIHKNMIEVGICYREFFEDHRPPFLGFEKRISNVITGVFFVAKKHIFYDCVF